LHFINKLIQTLSFKNAAKKLISNFDMHHDWLVKCLTVSTVTQLAWLIKH